MKSRFRIRWLLAACLSLPLVSRAQAPDPKYVVSVRELTIPAKARQAFQQGAERLAKQNPAGSLPLFQRAVAEFAGYYEAVYDIGVADLRLSRIEDAEQAFRKSIDMSGGKYAQPILGLGAILVYQEKFAQAEEYARKGLELEPSSWTGKYYLGWALFGLNRLAEAEKAVSEAFGQKSDSTEVLRLLADIHGRQKNYSAMMADLDEYLKLDPDSPTGTKAKALRIVAQRLLDESQSAAALGQSQY